MSSVRGLVETCLPILECPLLGVWLSSCPLAPGYCVHSVGTDGLALPKRVSILWGTVYIPAAINIANEDIGTEELPELPDKDQMLLVYCRSGRRSKEAAEKLAALGYTQVLEFGGIMTWTGEVISTEEEEWADDPFEAHEYGDPEDFYEDYGDNFDDYEEAEEYYYEHGGW